MSKLTIALNEELESTSARAPAKRSRSKAAAPKRGARAAAGANPYLYADGMLNFGAIDKLQARVAKLIKTYAKSEEPVEVLGTFVTKRRAKPVPFKASLAEKKDPKYMAARATKVIYRKRVAPEALARVAILLQIADDAKLASALKQAQSAILRHQKKCESVGTQVQKIKGKMRDEANAAFDSAVSLFKEKMSGVLKDTDIVESQGMMGKTVIVKLGPDDYVALTKADKTRFNAAKRAASESSGDLVSESAKTQMEKWGKDMLAIVHSVNKKIDGGFGGMSSSDGVTLKKAEGKKLLEAFKKAGYEPYEQIDNFYVIESKDDETVGVTIDFREEMSSASQCVIAFYSDDN